MLSQKTYDIIHVRYSHIIDPHSGTQIPSCPRNTVLLQCSEALDEAIMASKQQKSCLGCRSEKQVCVSVRDVGC